MKVVEKKVIKYVVEEEREEGIEKMILVKGRKKDVIEDYLDEKVEIY